MIIYRLFDHLRKYYSHLVLMSFVEETFGLGVLMSLVEVAFLHPCLGNALPEKNAVQTEFRRGGGSVPNG